MTDHFAISMEQACRLSRPKDKDVKLTGSKDPETTLQGPITGCKDSDVESNEMLLSDDDDPFSRYNNIFWTRVSLRNSRKAGYAKSAVSSEIDTGYTRRYSRNSSRRKSRRDRRLGDPTNSQPQSHPKSHPDSHPEAHPKSRTIGLPTQVSCDLEDDVFWGNPVMICVEDSEGNSRLPVSVTSSNSLDSTTSSSPNPYNNFNHSIHTMLVSPCCIVFFFLCCIPAVYYMELSDKRFQCGQKGAAQRYARRSTLLFMVGLALTLGLSTLVLFLVIFFTAQ